MYAQTCIKWQKAFGRVAGLLTQFVILIQCLGKHFVLS